MTSGAVEAVARVLCRQAGFDPDGAARVGYGWINYEKNAAEVIAAMPATPSDQEKLISELREALEQTVRALDGMPASMRPDTSGAWALLTRTEGT